MKPRVKAVENQSASKTYTDQKKDMSCRYCDKKGLLKHVCRKRKADLERESSGQNRNQNNQGN